MLTKALRACWVAAKASEKSTRFYVVDLALFVDTLVVTTLAASACASACTCTSACTSASASASASTLHARLLEPRRVPHGYELIYTSACPACV